MSKQESEVLICAKCNEMLTMQKTVFNYMGFTFKSEMPRCPSCGLVYLSEDVVRGKIAEVEMRLENK